MWLWYSAWTALRKKQGYTKLLAVGLAFYSTRPSCVPHHGCSCIPPPEILQRCPDLSGRLDNRRSTHSQSYCSPAASVRHGQSGYHPFPARLPSDSQAARRSTHKSCRLWLTPNPEPLGSEALIMDYLYL